MEKKALTPRREIKFRAWDAANGVMVYDGFFVCQKTGKCFYTQSVATYESDGGMGDNIDELLDCGEEEPTLMQFTGMYDKNGKEIYEGDIVSFQDFQSFEGEGDYIGNTGICEWISEPPMFHFTKRNEVEMSDMDFDFVQVIGNIYERHSLLPANLAVEKTK